MGSVKIKDLIKSCLECKALPGMLVMAVIFVMGVLSTCLHPLEEADFLGLYMAVVAFKQGLNPYHAAAVLHLKLYPLLYLPYALYLFYPFTWLGYALAARIFLTLKLMAIVGLLSLWHRLFNLNQYRGLFYAVVPLAFGGGLLWDWRLGNVSIFEQLLIWLGFYFYCKGRNTVFGVAIILAGSLKFVPILLLGLLAARWRKKELWLGALCFVLFLVLVAAGAAAWPDLTGSFWENLHGLRRETGEGNAASWEFINDVTDWLLLKTGGRLPALAPFVIYAVLVGGILAVTGALFWRLRQMEQKRADLWRICLTCLAYALIVPRMKGYSYIILIAPAFFILNSSRWVNPVLPFYGLLVLFTFRSFQFLGPNLEPFYCFQNVYYCLWLACVLFALCCRCIWRETASPTNRSG